MHKDIHCINMYTTYIECIEHHGVDSHSQCIKVTKPLLGDTPILCQQEWSLGVCNASRANTRLDMHVYPALLHVNTTHIGTTHVQ